MRRSTQRGFTLFEAVAAIVILAISTPPMMFAIRQAHRDRVGPVMASKARWLAVEKLEDIIADRHSSTRGYAYLIGASYPDEPTINGFTGFSRTVALTETGADLTSSGVGYKRAAVTLSWRDGVGAAQSLTLSTLLTDYP